MKTISNSIRPMLALLFILALGASAHHASAPTPAWLDSVPEAVQSLHRVQGQP